MELKVLKLNITSIFKVGVRESQGEETRSRESWDLACSMEKWQKQWMNMQVLWSWMYCQRPCYSAGSAVLARFSNSNWATVMYLEPQVSVEYWYTSKAVMLLYLHTIYVSIDFAPHKL
jgi:hypothetical protein